MNILIKIKKKKVKIKTVNRIIQDLACWLGFC